VLLRWEQRRFEVANLASISVSNMLYLSFRKSGINLCILLLRHRWMQSLIFLECSWQYEKCFLRLTVCLKDKYVFQVVHNRRKAYPSLILTNVDDSLLLTPFFVLFSFCESCIMEYSPLLLFLLYEAAALLRTRKLPLNLNVRWEKNPVFCVIVLEHRWKSI
jgi:hypothetical protein